MARLQGVAKPIGDGNGIGDWTDFLGIDSQEPSLPAWLSSGRQTDQVSRQANAISWPFRRRPFEPVPSGARMALC
jgi:hypothetical protein